METKVIIIGKKEILKQEPKKIEFCKAVTKTVLVNPLRSPSAFNNIELISRNYDGGYDLMYAYHLDRNDGTLYLGYFNDGVV